MQNFSTFIANHLFLFYTLATTFVALAFVEYLRLRRDQVRVVPKDAVLLINKKNAVVIDIRPANDFRAGHIVDAINLPVTDVTPSSKKLDKYRTKPVIIVCNNGIESQKSAANLTKHGFLAYTLNGGLRAWSNAELPLVKE